MTRPDDSRPAAQEQVALEVKGVEWWFSVAAVTRVGRDLFIKVALDGPEACLLTMQVRDRIVLGSTAAEMLTAACEWLLERGAATHGFIDLAESRHRWAVPAVA
jgi:hypothetical protein